jgi:hypothetical protein
MTLIDSACLASALYHDLHSSANENFVSSLLTAAITENERFRRWLAVDVAGLSHKLSAGALVATPNDTIPRCLAGMGPAGHAYRHPDLTIWDRREERHWDDLEKRKRAPASLLGALHAVYVEVKWFYVSPDDGRKYSAFLEKIEPWPNLRFLLLVSYSDSDVERIRRTARYAYEKPLHRLLNHRGIIVRTYSAALKAIRQSMGGVKKSVSYPATALARDYLRLLVEPEAVVGFWRRVCDDSKKDRNGAVNLRDAIARAAIQIALGTGYISAEPRLFLAGRGSGSRNCLVFASEGRRVRMENHDGRADLTRFRIRVEEIGIDLDFQLADPSPKKVTNRLKRLRQALRRAPPAAS